MAKRKPIIRSSKSTVEVQTPDRQYAGVGYREDYPLTGVSESGRRVGPFQLYRRGIRGGKYQSREAREAREWELKQLRLARSKQGGDRFQLTFDRDIRILICLGTIVATFILLVIVMNILFDAVGTTMGTLGLSTADFNSFRVTATLAFGAIVAIIVGAGSAMFLFKEDEVDDSIFEA